MINISHPAPPVLPGWRRYRCGGCQYQREVFGTAVAPDCCSNCGRPWVSVSDTVGGAPLGAGTIYRLTPPAAPATPEQS
jgi:ribosomal protein S27E